MSDSRPKKLFNNGGSLILKIYEARIPQKQESDIWMLAPPKKTFVALSYSGGGEVEKSIPSISRDQSNPVWNFAFPHIVVPRIQ